MIKLFVVGYPLDIQEAELMNLFSIYGTVNSIELLFNRLTQEHKGFGFIEMADQEAADKVIAAVNGMVIRGRKIRVKLADEHRAERPTVVKTNDFHSQELQGALETRLANNTDSIRNKRPRKLVSNLFRKEN